MRDVLKIFSFIKKEEKNIDLQMEKYISAISVKPPGVEVLKPYCYSKEVCVFVGLHSNNSIIMRGIKN